jgi:hypothetical protein
MNAPLRQVLHDAIDRQCDAPAPAGLAEATIARYRRQRRVRTALTGVGALAVAAAVAVPLAATVTAPAPGQSSADPGTPKRVVITAQAGLAPRTPSTASTASGSTTWSAPASLTSLLLNTKTGKYDELPYWRVLPSPDGRWAAVQKIDPGQQLYPNRTGVLNRADGKVRWLDRHDSVTVEPIGWSPDSTRFLIPEPLESGRPGVVLVEAATLATTAVPVPDLTEQNAAGLEMVWAPSGDGLLLTLTRDLTESGYQVLGIREYDLAGKPRRTLPGTAGGVLRTATQFSADGTRVVLFDPHGANPTIFDLATGAATALPASLPSEVGDFVGWYDADHLVYEAREATADSTSKLLVVSMHNAVVRKVSLPRSGEYQQVHLSPARHLSGPAAKHAF